MRTNVDVTGESDGKTAVDDLKKVNSQRLIPLRADQYRHVSHGLYACTLRSHT